MVVRKARLEVNAIEGTPASVTFSSTNHSLGNQLHKGFGLASSVARSKPNLLVITHYIVYHRNGHDATFNSLCVWLFRKIGLMWAYLHVYSLA